jgi:hypothetical protein
MMWASSAPGGDGSSSSVPGELHADASYILETARSPVAHCRCSSCIPATQGLLQFACWVHLCCSSIRPHRAQLPMLRHADMLRPHVTSVSIPDAPDM